jgi:nucleotide-binding universal stress UspA family protein
MSIKRILVPLPSAADHTGEIEMALAAAKSLAACVDALYISAPPPPPRVTAQSYGYGGTAVARAPVYEFSEESNRLMREAHARFSEACTAQGIPMLPANEQSAAVPAACWHEAEGEYVDVAMRRAAAYDLMVAASAAVVNSLKDIAEQSLLQTRRPVLLAPTRMQTRLTDTAMIAWDESPECWHAITAAIPFLKVAKSVQVVSVDKDAARRTASQAEALTYLRCHGIDATAKVVAPQLRSVGDTLLSTASEADVGLLVMGAYSHSRLREMLLGGATRHVLQNATARPVLLMH